MRALILAAIVVVGLAGEARAAADNCTDYLLVRQEAATSVERSAAEEWIRGYVAGAGGKWYAAPAWIEYWCQRYTRDPKKLKKASLINGAKAYVKQHPK